MRFLVTVILVAACLVSGGAFAAEQMPPIDPLGPGQPPLLGTPPLSKSPSFLTPPPPHAADVDAATYARCMALTKTDPAAAKKLAEGWVGRGGAHPAEHCVAVALIGLGQYKEAAGRLETLAGAMIHAPAELRSQVLDQAGQAWLLGGDAAHAYATDGAAIGLRPDDPELLIDRAEAAGEAGWFDKAVADLDRVLKTDPARLDALIYRASAYRQLGQLDPALADIDTALKRSPDSVPALLERGNILRLKNDTAGARRDWQRVATLAPGSAAANAAKANIERLDSLGQAAPKETPPRH